MPTNRLIRAAIAVELVAERWRQREREGFTDRGDDGYTRGELADAAACYAHFAACGDTVRAKVVAEGKDSRATFLRLFWPWRRRWWKPGDRRRDLIKAGALIIAEIERLDRLEKGGRA